MSRHPVAAPLTLLLLPPALLAQQSAQDSVLLELRITAASPATNSVTIDRGRRDGVLPNDLITFRARDGSTFRGTVLRVEDRSSLVELQDRSVRAEPGTPGEVRIPRERLPKPSGPEPGPAPAPTPDPKATPQPQAPEHPGWPNADKGYQPGMPLLAGVRPQQPGERQTRLSGRLFSRLSLAHTPAEDGWANSYFRVGTDLEVDNPFGHGGRLQFDGEFDRRTERNDLEGVDLLLRRFSYAWGGHRFEPSRVELGRFLQHGVPEFGVLDGVEYGRRLDNGDRVGASIGYLPEPDDDFDSLNDFQIAGHYTWNLDDEEVTRLTAAAQISWHAGSDDRDLLLLKYEHAPLDDWRLFGTLWLDYYRGGEVAQSTGLELTQAVLFAGRHWSDGSGLDLLLRHITLPDVRRYEYWTVTPQEVRNDRYDRLDVTAWTPTAGQGRLHGNLNVWGDEQDTAVGGELGIDRQDLLLSGCRADLTAFGTLGRFTTVFGGRVTLSSFDEHGSWNLLYELAHNDMVDRPGDSNDLLQHRLACSRDFLFAGGWTLAVDFDLVWWDGDPALAAGAYLQKTF